MAERTRGGFLLQDCLRLVHVGRGLRALLYTHRAPGPMGLLQGSAGTGPWSKIAPGPSVRSGNTPMRIALHFRFQ